MRAKKFWIKERHNPQLGVYYVPMGQLSMRGAKAHERTNYGYNYMHEYPDEKSYNAKLSELRKQGLNVH